MNKRFIWRRWKEDGATVTKTDDDEMTKEDWLDCLTDVMTTGDISIIDVLDHFSPTNRYKR